MSFTCKLFSHGVVLVFNNIHLLNPSLALSETPIEIVNGKIEFIYK